MAKILYTEVDDFLRKGERYKLLNDAGNVYKVDWREITPDKKHNWLTEGMQDDWEECISIGTKEGKSNFLGRTNDTYSLFSLYSLGVSTNRDSWVYNYDTIVLTKNIQNTIEFFNEHAFKYSRINPKPVIDDFVNNDDTKISWSATLKNHLPRLKTYEFSNEIIRKSLYRPFDFQYLYFNNLLIDRQGQFPKIFPTPDTEKENLVICVPSKGGRLPFWTFITNCIPNLTLTSLDANQCFPFYTYNEDGTGRRENITDWALEQYRSRYGDNSITKWDIFYYIYGALHKPDYRTKYAANLRRELPRIPFYNDFRLYAEAGKRLAELHVGYESQPEYYLQKIEAPGKQLDWRVEKMHLSKDKTMIIYNGFLTLAGIPREAFDYKLGNRSALDWIIDQYQVKTDKRSGIVNDPNRLEEPDYIVRLIGKIITVSLETMKIAGKL